MASPAQWTWVWANSGRWWRTGRPDVLWFMGSQRLGHDWTTEPQTIHVYPDWSSLISGREPSGNSGTSHGLWRRCLGPQLHLECCKYTTDGALVKVLRYSCRELQVKQKLSLWFLYFSSFSTLYLYNTSALWFEHIYFYYTLDSTLFAYITFHSILVYLIKLSSSVSCLDSGTDRYSLRANLRQALRRTPVSWKRHYLVWVDALHLSLCRLQFP